MQTKPVCIFLIGTPLSGKSTFRNAYLAEYPSTKVISRDDIRFNDYDFPYRISQKNEKEINDKIVRMLEAAKATKTNVISDNTNCRMMYLNQFMKVLGDDYDYQYSLFEAPMFILWLRNIKRKYTQGIWIPMKVVKRFKKRYEHIKGLLNGE